MEGMRGKEVWNAARSTAAHVLLLTFTIVLVLKLHPDSSFSLSWWFIFSPLWLFHAVVYRWRFSMPAPSNQHLLPWDPFHSVVAMPLLIAFELLLCVYLESSHALNLEIVFLPIYVLGTIILLENLRMCCPLILAEIKISCLREELTPSLREWRDGVETQLGYNFWAVISMAFSLGATAYLVQMILEDPPFSPGRSIFAENVDEVNFWGPYFFSSGGFLFAIPPFLEGMGIHDQMRKATEGSSSTSALAARLVIRGQWVMVAMILGFPVLLCMYLQGTPDAGTKIPIPFPIVFSPLFLLQGVGVFFSTLHLVERTVFLVVHSESGHRRYLTPCSRACEFLVSIGHGLRFLGWGSVDDGSREVEARRLHECESGCNTFFGSPPAIVMKMPMQDLINEVCTLQAAINEQIQLMGCSQQEYERLQNEKVLCRLCFQRNIDAVLLPCRHRILCRICGEECSNCPICRVSIAKLVCCYYA